MSKFDVIVKGGMVHDGPRVPRYQAGGGIEGGKIAEKGGPKQ